MTFQIGAAGQGGQGLQRGQGAGRGQGGGRAQNLKNAGIPEEIIQQGRDAVKDFAASNGIQLPQPPAHKGGQRAENGGIEGLQMSLNGSGEVGGDRKAKRQEALMLAGVPLETIAQGKEAVHAYAEANNIQLPPPPQKGGQLNLVG